MNTVVILTLTIVWLHRPPNTMTMEMEDPEDCFRSAARMLASDYIEVDEVKSFKASCELKKVPEEKQG